MKKLFYIPAAAVLVFGGIVLADAGASSKLSQPPVEAAGDATKLVEVQQFISLEEADKIAQAKAQGGTVELKLSGDDDDPHYVVEVKREQTVEQFEINALDGSVRETGSKSQAERPAVANKQQPLQKADSKKQLIGKQQAVTIARTVASGKADDVELEKEHGMLVYEVELEDGDTEYEVIVDAVTGTVLHVETDYDD